MDWSNFALRSTRQHYSRPQLEGPLIQTDRFHRIVFLALSLLSLSAFGASESEEILYRLRPSELRAHREFEANFGVVPGLSFMKGPTQEFQFRGILPMGLMLGCGFGIFLTEGNQIPTFGHLTAGYALPSFLRGAWIAASAGYTARGNAFTPIGLRGDFSASVGLGWDFKIGRYFSIGPSVSYRYFSNAFIGDRSGPNLPLQIDLPLRIWF